MIFCFELILVSFSKSYSFFAWSASNTRALYSGPWSNVPVFKTVYFVNLSFCFLSVAPLVIATTSFSTETSILSIKYNKGTTFGCVLAWGTGLVTGCGYKIHDILVTVTCTLLLCRKRQLSSLSTLTDSSSADKKKYYKILFWIIDAYLVLSVCCLKFSGLYFFL